VIQHYKSELKATGFATMALDAPPPKCQRPRRCGARPIESDHTRRNTAPMSKRGREGMRCGRFTTIVVWEARRFNTPILRQGVGIVRACTARPDPARPECLCCSSAKGAVGGPSSPEMFVRIEASASKPVRSPALRSARGDSLADADTFAELLVVEEGRIRDGHVLRLFDRNAKFALSAGDR